MPTPIPIPAAQDSTGLPDSQWVTDVRDGLRDYPLYVTETWTANGVDGVVGAAANPLRIQKPPINDGSLTVRDNTTATNYTVITSGTPTGTQVKANYDTGELIFASAPANNDAIQISYQYCKWRDYSIETGLYAGLRAMFPRVGREYTDTTIQIKVNTWDYALPPWAEDPRSRVYKVEVADPFIPTQPFQPLQGGFTVISNMLHLATAQRYSPVARLRVSGWGPYLTLGDMEPQLYHLPIWYALGTLLPKQEAKRIREDTAVPVSQEGGQAPGLLTQTGDYYKKQFEAELASLSKTGPRAWGIRIGTTYGQRANRYR